jgi:hypothetical protein
LRAVFFLAAAFFLGALFFLVATKVPPDAGWYHAGYRIR